MRRRRAQPDSLELLLDTMCNTFGGIILIALLIALLSRDASSDTALRDRTETVRRQLDQARAQIAEAERLRSQLASDTNSIRKLAMLAERDELQQEIESARQTAQSNLVAAAALPMADDPSEVERMAAEKQARLSEARALEEQVQRENLLRQRQVRLPRERDAGKKPFYFIVRFGKIYPVHGIQEGRRIINQQSLEWASTPNGETAAPRRDLGMDLNGFARGLGEIPGPVYSIHFLVYNDSFPIFMAARQIPLQRGYDAGWEFLPEDKPIVFSPRGEAPPAL